MGAGKKRAVRLVLDQKAPVMLQRVPADALVAEMPTDPTKSFFAKAVRRDPSEALPKGDYHVQDAAK